MKDTMVLGDLDRSLQSETLGIHPDHRKYAHSADFLWLLCLQPISLLQHYSAQTSICRISELYLIDQRIRYYRETSHLSWR